MIKKSLTNNIFNKMNLNKFICEMCGTFLLVFVGTSAAVFSGNFLGTALAFGFSLTLAAYTVSRNTGCHINPAVSLAMVCNKKIG
jgi:aquaporin Z